LREVKFDIADVDAAVLDIVEGLVVDLGVVEEGFGGNAAHVQTCAAEGAALFYACYLCCNILLERLLVGGRRSGVVPSDLLVRL
jgi:hypothetical protein